MENTLLIIWAVGAGAAFVASAIGYGMSRDDSDDLLTMIVYAMIAAMVAALWPIALVFTVGMLTGSKARR